MAERKQPGFIEKGLRFAENKISWTHGGAVERRRYERRVQALSEPESSHSYQQEIRHIKNLVDSLVPLENRPQRESFEHITLSSRVFKNPNQIVNSDHNASHMAIAASMSVLRGSQLVHQGLVSPENINFTALWVGALLHDTQRGGDLVDSIPPLLRRHGIVGATHADSLMQHLKVPETEREKVLPIVQEMLQYHDSRKGLKQPQYKELGILEFTDRMALGRLFESSHASVRLTAGEIVGRRMRRYHEKSPDKRDPFVTPADISAYSQIAGAMDILIKKKIKTERLTQPEDIVKATLDIAQGLGLFATAQEGETDPHMKALRRETPIAA